VGRVDNEDENHKSIEHVKYILGRSLIYGNGEQSIRLGYWKCERETQECNVT